MARYASHMIYVFAASKTRMWCIPDMHSQTLFDMTDTGDDHLAAGVHINALVEYRFAQWYSTELGQNLDRGRQLMIVSTRSSPPDRSSTFGIDMQLWFSDMTKESVPETLFLPVFSRRTLGQDPIELVIVRAYTQKAGYFLYKDF